MKKIQKTMALAVILSQTSHVFCCVLPFVVSSLSVLAGIGIISSLPAGFQSLHEALHSYEVSLLVFSGAVLVAGWLLHFVSLKYDCHSTGCVHGPCEPKKVKISKLLIGATALFIFNIAVYTLSDHGKVDEQSVHAESLSPDHAQHHHK